MDTMTMLVAVIAGSVFWAFVVREPALALVSRVRQWRRSVPLKAAPAPVPAPEHDAADVSMTLILCDGKGHQEYEITVHGADAPETYRYGGKLYRQEKRRHTKHAHDIIWEYTR